MLEFPLNLLFEQRTQDWIDRYLFCEKFNTKPFDAKSYDELPGTWVDFCKIMMRELTECEKESHRMKNSGNS